MKKSITLLVSAVLLGGGAAVYIRSAVAQTNPFQIFPLAQGLTTEKQIKLHTKGPAAVVQLRMTLDPLGEVPWHTHPGPGIIVVTQGVLQQTHSNGCVSVHQPGSVFFEEEGEVHQILNPSASQTAEAYATFIIPPTSQPLIPVGAPALNGCNPGQSKKH